MKSEQRPRLKIRVIVKAAVAVAVCVLLIGMAVLEMRSLVQLQELQSQISYLQDTTDVIQTDVTNMEANIEATLEQESSLLETWSVQLQGCDFEAGTYQVLVSLVPKTYTDTMVTSIFFGTQEFALQQEGYIYSGVVTLPIDTEYDGNVTVLFSDGNKKNTEVLRNYQGFQSSVRSVLSGIMGKEPVYHDGQLTVKNDVTVNLEGNGKFSFDEFVCVTEMNDEPVFVWDIVGGKSIPVEEYKAAFSNGQVQGNGEENSHESELENSDSADAENPNGADPNDAKPNGVEPNAAESNAAEPNSADSNGAVTGIPQTAKEVLGGITTSFPLDLELEVPAGSKVRIYLRAVTEENYRFEYDVFNAYTAETGDGFAEAATYYLSNYVMYDDKGAAWKVK